MLGVALFERRGRSLVLTEAGGRVLDAAHLVLKEVARAEDDLAALAAGRRGTLRVTAECYTTYHWLPPILAVYRVTYPDIDIVLAAEASDHPDEALRARETDVALLTHVESPGGLTLTELFEDEVVAVIPEGHPWASQAWISPSCFEDQHVFTYHTCESQDCVLSLVADAGATPARVTPVPLSTEGAVGMVRAGLGVTTMAQWAAAPYLLQGGLVAVPITASGVRRTWYAATREGTGPPYLQAFVEMMEKEMAIGIAPTA